MDLFSNAAFEGGSARGRLRIGAIDAARGCAVLAMIAYHTAWDLSELRLIATEVTVEPGWRIFARAIASSFLVLVGVGLVLAHGDTVRPRVFLPRLGAIVAAALVVTVATVFAFPDSYIFFGILHAVAVSSVLAIPLLRAPAWAAGIAAALVFLGPILLTQPVFDQPILAFLGLGSRVPLTNDWVPVFPWSGFVFAGLAVAKLARPRLERARGATYPPFPLRVLGALGRHSLIIYLLHQPLLFGALSGVVALTGPNPAAVTAPFIRSCLASCRGAGASDPVCGATCRCAADDLQASPVWPNALAGRLSTEEQLKLGQIARACFARHRPET